LSLDQVAKAQHLFVFFKQHGQQEDLKGQDMGGVGSSGKMLVGGCEQVVEDQLVAPAQGAPEAGEGFLFAKEDLGDRR
jgi:hypothetical protein